MKKIFKSGWLVALGLLTLSCLISCEKEDDFASGPRVTCLAGAAGTAMLGETITINAANISPTTTVTVKFGKEKVITRTGPGMVSYAFSKSGLKSIHVTMDPPELAKTTWLLEVQALESLQTLAARLKSNPDLCLVMCHRANSSDLTIAENSLTAINKCIADKVDILENDVQTTKDGVLVVSHDDNLDRETTGSGQIANKTLSEIKKLYLRDRNGNATQDRMLTFDEYLDACKGRIYINVDIGDRNASVTQVVNAITRKGMIQQCLVYCNNVAKIQEAFKANPDCNVYCPTNATNRNATIEAGIPGNIYFTQASYYPSAKASRNGKDSEKSRTDPAWVAESAAYGTISTINAIYTLDTSTFYNDDFPVKQVEEIFELYPSCQCIHVDTGLEARQSLIAFGKQVR